MSIITVGGLIDTCVNVTAEYCANLGVSSCDLYAREAVMYYLGHPTANPAQWHEEWCKLRAAEGFFKPHVPGDNQDSEDKVDPRMKPLAELDELEQIKYVVFLNMFRTLRQLL